MKYTIFFFAICGAQHQVFFVSFADNGHSSALYNLLYLSLISLISFGVKTYVWLYRRTERRRRTTETLRTSTFCSYSTSVSAVGTSASNKFYIIATVKVRLSGLSALEPGRCRYFTSVSVFRG